MSRIEEEFLDVFGSFCGGVLKVEGRVGKQVGVVGEKESQN